MVSWRYQPLAHSTGLFGHVSLNALLHANSLKHPTLQHVTSSEDAKKNNRWTKNKTKEFYTCYIWKSFMKWSKGLDNTQYAKPYLMFEYTGSSISDIFPNSSCSLQMESLDFGYLSSPDWRSQSEGCLEESSTSGWCFGITEKNYLAAK